MSTAKWQQQNDNSKTAAAKIAAAVAAKEIKKQNKASKISNSKIAVAK